MAGAYHNITWLQSAHYFKVIWVLAAKGYVSFYCPPVFNHKYPVATGFGIEGTAFNNQCFILFAETKFYLQSLPLFYACRHFSFKGKFYFKLPIGDLGQNFAYHQM